MVIATGSAYCSCLIALRFQFSQINSDITTTLETGDYAKIMLMIKHHMSIEKEANSLNKQGRVHILFLYKIIKPTFNLLVYLSHSPTSTNLMVLITTLVVVMTAAIIFLETLLCASVSVEAHRPLKLLYKTLLGPKHRTMPVTMKLKIGRFVDRLTGPEIGFYCYNLFPINSYNFLDHVLDSGYSYLLIVMLIKDN